MSVRSSRAVQLRTAPLRLVRDDVEVVPYDTLIAEAQEAELHGRTGEARDLYELALRRISDAAHGARASDVLRWIARTYRTDGQLELALDCAEAAQAVAEAFGDVGAAGHATNLRAIIRWQQGDLDEAESLYQQARERAIDAGEAKLAAMTSQNLGVVANVRGDLDLAARHYEASLAAYRELGLAGDVCIALNNLGLLHSQRERWADAARAYDEAYRVADVLGDRGTCIHIEVNRAESLVAQGELTQALAACDRARQIAARVKEPRALGELHKAFGVVTREMGNHDLAEQYLADARVVAEQRQDLLLLAEALKESAELHRRQGRNRDTLQCLNRAHRLFEQLRARRELADVGRRMRGLESDFLEVVRKWGESIECKDQYTQGHCERVADLACALAARTGMDEQSLFWFRIGALLHDVGKLVIPAEVLNKAGKLTDEEWALVRRHPSAGVEMLADVEFPWDVRPIVESHHERWDGKGYPHGLQGDAIPLVARILCIADVYDALTSERSYKKAMSHQDALDVMRLQAGVEFDPRLFALFETVAGERAARATEGRPGTDPRGFAHATVVSHPDELTGLPLRGAFNDLARAALARRAAGEKASLLVIDVDHFKLINDSFGHQRGDEVLRSVAQTLRRWLPSGAHLARYGGDEFLVLLPGTGGTEAAEIGELLRAAVHGIPMALGHATPIAMTVSVGVATAPEHGVDIDALFGSADRALYDAKRQGRDMVARAGSAMPMPSLVTQLEQFSGRGAERAELAELLKRAVHGERQVVAIVGEGGVGKSALARELGPEVRLRAGSLVSGRCPETETRPPYAPWGTVLDAIRVLRVVPEQREWSALPHLVPALGDRRGHAGAPDRLELFGEVAEFLRLAAAARPIVVVLDDMQWADSLSWDLLEFLAARLDRERILLCITLRIDEVRDDVLVRRGRLSRDPRFHEVRLARFGRDELGAWLVRVLQQPVPDAWIDALHTRTEGNPFLVVQLVRAMMEQGGIWWSGRAWTIGETGHVALPTAARDLVGRRLARLSPEACRTLGAAAILGRRIDLDQAIAAGIGSEDDLLDAIDEGLAASVLEPSTRHGNDAVSFTHGLLVELLHEHVHPRRLRRIRERLTGAVATATPAPGFTSPSGDRS